MIEIKAINIPIYLGWIDENNIYVITTRNLINQSSMYVFKEEYNNIERFVIFYTYIIEEYEISVEV